MELEYKMMHNDVAHHSLTNASSQQQVWPPFPPVYPLTSCPVEYPSGQFGSAGAGSPPSFFICQ